MKRLFASSGPRTATSPKRRKFGFKTHGKVNRDDVWSYTNAATVAVLRVPIQLKFGSHLSERKRFYF
jgi:hypothetical protein